MPSESEGRPVSEEAPGAVTEPAPEEAEYPELEKRFSEPILKGHQGIDTAQIWISAFLVVIAAVIAYSNAFLLPLHPDDRELLFGPSAGQEFVGLGPLLQEFPRQPLAMLSLGLNAWPSPDSPVLFRIKSIGIHVVASVLVYLLARRLQKGQASEAVAMLAGLLFALHPLATEAVHLQLARGSLMAAVFSILSILLFLRATDDEERVRAWPFAGCLLCLVLAWGSKTAVVGLPVLVLAADWIVRGRRMTSGRFLAHLGYWAALLLLLAAHMTAFSTPAGAVEEPGEPFTVRLAALLPQITWMVAPNDLSVLHSTPAGESQAVLAGVLVLALLAAGLVLVAKRSLGGFALLWWAVFQLGWALMARTPYLASEFQAYLPLAGAVLLLPWAFQLVPSLGRLRTIAGVAAAILLVAAGVGTFNRTQVWQSAETLWGDAAASNPGSATPYVRLGQASIREGMASMEEAGALAQQDRREEASQRQAVAMENFRAAEERLKEAVQREPDSVEVQAALGQVHELLGQAESAAAAWRRVLELDPEHPEAPWHLAMATEAQGDPNDRAALSRAVELYRRADETGRMPGQALLAYGRALSALGAIEESREVLARAASEARGAMRPSVQNALQSVDGMAQAVGALQQQVSTAIQRDPQGVDALRLRGQLMEVTGHNLQAAYLLDEALEKNPQDSNAWVLLGLARARMGSAATFVQEWPSAPPMAPAEPRPWRFLARNTAAAGYWDGAQTYLEAAGNAGELQGVSPAVALGEVAAELNQPQRAAQSFLKAAEAVPTDPAPWLRLTDLAIAANDIPSAQTYYIRARERNAAPEELAKREEKIGDVPEQSAPAMLR